MEERFSDLRASSLRMDQGDLKQTQFLVLPSSLTIYYIYSRKSAGLLHGNEYIHLIHEVKCEFVMYLVKQKHNILSYQYSCVLSPEQHSDTSVSVMVMTL